MKTFNLVIITALFLVFNCQQKPAYSQPQNDLKLADSANENSNFDQAFPNRFSTGDQYLNIKSTKWERMEKEVKVNFNLSWDGSWRDPENHDAAWIFVKYKTDNGIWKHAKLKQVNTADSYSTQALEIKTSPDNVGCMIYRTDISQGDNDWIIGLTFNTVDSITDLKVLGLEMVYVAEGAFELGTLKSIRDRREVLTEGAGGAPYNPFFTFSSSGKANYGGVFKVESEDLIEIGPRDGNLYWIDADIPGTNTFSGKPEGNLSLEFPKGTKGFYQMKYELSQQEYCDFLNTLTPLQQKTRDFTGIMEYNMPISDYRNNIRKINGTYTTDRPDRPCNFISWLDGQAYADWAGLRHMTELEFEKASRGPEKAIYREYIWGVNEIKESENMKYSTGFYDNNGNPVDENGNELTDGNIHASMFSYFNMEDVCSPKGRFYDPDCAGCRSFTGGDGKRGPVRKGIFGKNSDGDRIKAGATYFGAMEMGGNLQEPVVTVGNSSGRKFKGTHGDGELTAEGMATNSDWQPFDGNYAFAGRGGCWKFHENHARTADRFKGLRTDENRRASHIGFRGVRSAF